MAPTRVVPVLLLLATAACYQWDVLRLDPVARAPIAPDSVRVLAQEPAESYKVVAIVSVVTDLGPGGLVRLAEQLKKKAAGLGANGLLFGAEPLSDTKNTQRMTGRAIVFDSVAPPVQPALGKPSYTRQIIVWSVFGGAVVAAGVYALLRPDSEPINPYDWNCNNLGACSPRTSP